MIDHLSLGVDDLARAGAFYDAVLASLGYVRLFTHPRAVGFGRPGDADETFAVLHAAGVSPTAGSHIAFAGASRAAIDHFHATALREGATTDGPPGLRPAFGVGYYAAFVRDLDGHRIEAVFHERAETSSG